MLDKGNKLNKLLEYYISTKKFEFHHNNTFEKVDERLLFDEMHLYELSYDFLNEYNVLGVEGLEVRDRVHVLLADQPVDFTAHLTGDGADAFGVVATRQGVVAPTPRALAALDRTACVDRDALRPVLAGMRTRIATARSLEQGGHDGASGRGACALCQASDRCP